MWTEQAGDQNAMTKIFPRSYALAERYWSDPTTGIWCLLRSIFPNINALMPVPDQMHNYTSSISLSQIIF